MSHSQVFRVSRWKQSRPWAWLPAFTLFLAAAIAAQAQPSRTDALIKRDRALIADADRLKLNAIQLGTLWARLGSEYQDQALFPESEAAYLHGLSLLEHEPTAQARYGIALSNLALLYMLTRRLDEAENCRKRSLAIFEKLGDPHDIARAQGHLAEVYLSRGNNKKAASFALLASNGLDDLPNAGGEDRASALLTYVYASCFLKHCDDGLSAAREVMRLVHAGSKEDPLAVGQAYVTLGFAEQHTGAVREAGGDLREGVRILEGQLPPSHPLLLEALEAYRRYLADNHREAEAAQVAERERISPPARNCSSCTVSVQGLRTH
jgi:tetratricopeptide (TPR) repeat protein